MDRERRTEREGEKGGEGDRESEVGFLATHGVLAVDEHSITGWRRLIGCL